MKKTHLRYNRREIKSEIKKNGNFEIDISPSANYLTVTEDTGYTVPQATCDIIDNSLDAGATFINYTIKTENKLPCIIIADNGIGMDEATLCGSLVLGASLEELGEKQKGIYGDQMNGKFGTGMKTSLATYQGKTTILSKMIGSPLYKITYDIGDIKERAKKEMELGNFTPGWKVDIETANDLDKNIFEAETRGSDHGTVLITTDIKRFKVTNIQTEKQKLLREVRRIYRKFIMSGKEFYINDKKLDPSDPMVYDIPFDDGNGQAYKSELLSTHEWNNLPYIDKNGNEKRTGWMRYNSYILPSSDDQLAKDQGWSVENGGGSIIRHDREIMWHQHLGIYVKNSALARFRFEIEFSSEMDNEWGLAYTKIKVVPNQRTIDKISPIIKSDVTRARNKWEARNHSKKVTKKQKKHAGLFINHMRRVKPSLPMLPTHNPNPNTNTKKPVPTGRKNKSYNPTDNLIISYFDGLPDGKVFEGFLRSNGSKKIELMINTNHILNKEFMVNGNDKLLSALHGWMWAFTQAKWCQAPDGKDLDPYLQKFEQIETQMGAVLSTVLEKCPK